MSKFAHLDEKITARIRKAPCTFTDLRGDKQIDTLAERLTTPNSLGFRENWRLIDRRLQALRKSCVIKFEHGYWREVR
jgi:hypothetical protein